MKKPGVVAVLDVGTSKIVCFIAHISTAGKIEILGIGHQLSRGIRAGKIVDVKKAESCILSAINSAEKMAGESIDCVFLNAAGSMLESHMVDVSTNVSGQEITENDVSHVAEIANNEAREDEKDVIHNIAMDYTIDDLDGILDPVGMFGDELKTQIHVVSFSKTGIKNITHCMAKCQLDVAGFVAGPYASALATLSDDEKQLGVIHVDMGAGATSVSVFRDGYCVYLSSIPFGGDSVTRDIARGLSISIEYAERIKTIYGTVVGLDRDVHERIDIPLSEMQSDIEGEAIVGVGEESYISKELLTSIIKPRVEEILELVKKDLLDNGVLHNTGPRIVLAGGSSQLMGIKELAGHIFGKHVRCGKPHNYTGLAESVKGPGFANCAGMLEYIATEHQYVLSTSSVRKTIEGKGKTNKFIQWFKENF